MNAGGLAALCPLPLDLWCLCEVDFVELEATNHALREFVFCGDVGLGTTINPSKYKNAIRETGKSTQHDTTRVFSVCFQWAKEAAAFLTPGSQTRTAARCSLFCGKRSI
jgi:hypothetical protein